MKQLPPKTAFHPNEQFKPLHKSSYPAGNFTGSIIGRNRGCSKLEEEIRGTTTPKGANCLNNSRIYFFEYLIPCFAKGFPHFLQVILWKMVGITGVSVS